MESGVQMSLALINTSTATHLRSPDVTPLSNEKAWIQRIASTHDIYNIQNNN